MKFSEALLFPEFQEMRDRRFAMRMKRAAMLKQYNELADRMGELEREEENLDAEIDAFMDKEAA
jgi:hypothetical protein